MQNLDTRKKTLVEQVKTATEIMLKMFESMKSKVSQLEERTGSSYAEMLTIGNKKRDEIGERIQYASDLLENDLALIETEADFLRKEAQVKMEIHDLKSSIRFLDSYFEGQLEILDKDIAG